MTNKKQPVRTPPEEVTITRAFDAPRDLVFSAWTDPAHVAKWWGPGGFTSRVISWEARPGSPIRIDMHAPNGAVYPMDGTIREVVPPERFVFVSGALDGDGKSMFDVLTTVTFADLGARTGLTLVARVLRKTPQADPYIKGMKAGWTQSLDRLAAFVAGGDPGVAKSARGRMMGAP